MTTSQDGRVFLETMESIRFTAYRDSGGIWTIGVGHIKGVKSGDTCTQEQAHKWLSEDLQTAENAVNQHVSVILSQNEFDALVSLTFNIGASGFAHSTLVRLLNGEDRIGAANQFLQWIRVKGVVSPGLLNRRTAERLLFLTTTEKLPV